MSSINAHLAAAHVAALILEILGVVHLFWALGGEAGRALAVPTLDGKPVIQPSAAGTAAVGVGLLACAAFVLALGDAFGPPPHYLRIFGIAVASVFFVRAVGDFRYVGVFKRVKGSPFARWDTLAYSPLCFLLAELIVRAAMG